MISAKTRLAGVVGAPVAHSLSPRLHNAWIERAGLDAAYVAFAPRIDRFAAFVEGLRYGVVAGLNVTIPFKEQALALADRASPEARAAGAANVLLFDDDGTIEARNTDGEGLLEALKAQADFEAADGPCLVFGAGGAARGAVAALVAAGAPEVRIVNRSLDRAEALAGFFPGRARAFPEHQIDLALRGAAALINATSLGLGGGPGPHVPWSLVAPSTVAMDMIYRPLETHFLGQALVHGCKTVDGLEMLVRQAIPSFAAFFGQPPPDDLDARTLLEDALEPTP